MVLLFSIIKVNDLFLLKSKFVYMADLVLLLRRGGDSFKWFGFLFSLRSYLCIKQL